MLFWWESETLKNFEDKGYPIRAGKLLIKYASVAKSMRRTELEKKEWRRKGRKRKNHMKSTLLRCDSTHVLTRIPYVDGVPKLSQYTVYSW